MRTHLLILTFLSIANLKIKAHNNLIPNSGFELGNKGPRCEYGVDDFGQFSDVKDAIQIDIFNWTRATCSNVFGCTNKYSSPDWMDSQNCGILPVNQTKYIYLEEDKRDGYQDAIRV